MQIKPAGAHNQRNLINFVPNSSGSNAASVRCDISTLLACRAALSDEADENR
jgi:hypothetical protein